MMVDNLDNYNSVSKKLYLDIELDATDAKLIAQRANLYTQMGKKAKVNKTEQQAFFHLALADYNQAIKLINNNAIYYSERAAIYLKLKQYDTALADCLQAKLLNPLETRYHKELIKIQMLCQKTSVAGSLKQVKFGAEIMAGAVLFALAGAFIWGTGEILCGAPFILGAFFSFIIGIIKIFYNEMELYQLQQAGEKA